MPSPDEHGYVQQPYEKAVVLATTCFGSESEACHLLVPRFVFLIQEYDKLEDDQGTGNQALCGKTKRGMFSLEKRR